MFKDLATMFGGFILTLLIYFQVPYLDNIALILLWVAVPLVIFGFGIIAIWFDQIKDKVREQYKNKSKLLLGGSELLSIFGIYLLHLAGQEALVTVMIILKMIAYTFIYFVYKEEPK